MRHSLFLFGEAEKGALCTPHFCHSLEELADRFGNPPEDSKGLLFAVQALMYDQDLIFFRVSEEGFSRNDYLKGVDLLRDQSKLPQNLSAICMPGVGDRELIDTTSEICHKRHSLLIIDEHDLYDYLAS